MNRFLKIALIVFGVLAALIATAAIVLPLIVNPNQYKDEIAAAVQEKTGRELAIPGDIGLSVFPWLGVELGELRLSNAAGFGEEPFAEIGGAGVRVKLLPLLRKRIEIGTVTLSDMRLRLARKANGVTNWDDLTEAFAEEPTEKEPEENPDGFAMPDLQIEAIRIENAAVSFDDRAAGERYELSEVNLSTGRLRLNERFPLELSFLFAAREMGMTVRGNLVTQIEPDLESQFVNVPGFKLELLAEGESLPNGRQQILLTGDGEFDARAENLQLRDLRLQADETNVTGEAGVNGFETPEITFRLALDKLDVDRYLSSGGGDKPAAKPAADGGGAEIDLEPLKAVNLDGRLTAGKLKVANLHIEDAELVITARNGVLRIEPLGANLYGGALRMQSTVNAAGKRPTYTIKGDLNGLNFGPLLKDLIDTEKLDGLANLTLDLTTSGTTTGEMIRSLDGRVGFEFSDGVFQGFNLPQLLEAARRNYKEAGAAELEPAGKTEFSRFAASFKVDDGLMSGRDLSLRSSAIDATGAGSYNLAANKLDYTVNAKILESAGGKLAELAGLTIPIKLSGDLFSPRFSIDMAGALKGAAKQKLQEEKQELKQKADERVEEKKREVDEKVQKEVQEGLKKLFER